jgi:hypothetical protein
MPISNNPFTILYITNPFDFLYLYIKIIFINVFKTVTIIKFNIYLDPIVYNIITEFTILQI